MKLKILYPTLFVCVLFLGCAHIRESDWLNYNTQYASWEHAKFSICGYRNPTVEDVRLSKEQNWWGKAIKVKRSNRQIWYRPLNPAQVQ